MKEVRFRIKRMKYVREIFSQKVKSTKKRRKKRAKKNA